MNENPALNWIEIRLQIGNLESHLVDGLAAVLVDECGGIEELPGEQAIRGYVPANDSGKSIIALIQSEIRGIARANDRDADDILSNITTRTIQNVDWATNWKEFYTPQRVGQHFLIYPSWEKPDHVGSEDILVQLDPGQAFGTGQHESTQLCLELMESIPIHGKRVADVGCGSGILSIAAAKLHAAEIQACDIDPLAVDATETNAGINRVSNHIVTTLGGAQDLSGSFDIVFANIIAEALLRISEDLCGLLNDSGTMIWSGIVRERTGMIEQYLRENDLAVRQKRQRGEWFSYQIVKNFKQ